MTMRCMWVLVVLVVGWHPQAAFAKDHRVALLVVNQQGWPKDPLLRYAVDGDLRPLSKELRRLGFAVIELINQTPQALRKALQRLTHKMTKQRSASTFLFYYSGHADRTHLHMGPKQEGAFSYKEFLSSFQQIPSQRRFAIFDACFSGEVIRLFGSLSRYRQLLQEGRLKGVRKRSSINISQLKFPNQGQEEGIRIITSSLQMSWELNRYKASVFTYHLLRGIRGAADLDNDGKISVDELFDFTSREVKLVTGQKPQQLVVARRARPYALAPAYRSRLRIGARVTGTLHVSVANFLWSHHKAQGKPLTLALVHGKGQVRLQHAQRCWSQAVLLPKGGELALGTQWRKVPCQRLARLRQKGYLVLPVRLAAPPLVTGVRSLGIAGGMALQGIGSLQRLQPSIALTFQWQWWQADLGFSHGFVGDSSFSLSRVFLQTAAGAPLTWSWPGWQMRLFVGGFVRGGLVLQHQDQQDSAITLHGVAGGLAQLAFWFDHWGIRVGTSLGVDMTPSSAGLSFSPFWQMSSAVVWAI